MHTLWQFHRYFMEESAFAMGPCVSSATTGRMRELLPRVASMPLQGIASSGFAAATCFGMLVGETHAGAVVVELGRACGKQGRSGQRQRRFWQSLGNHQQWIYNMLRDESAVAADLCCCSRRVVFGIALYRCSRRKVLSVDLGCCSRSVDGVLALHVVALLLLQSEFRKPAAFLR